MLSLPPTPLPFMEDQELWDMEDWVLCSGTEELCRYVYISQTWSGSEGGVQLPSTEELCRYIYISQTGSGSEGGVQLPSTEELCRYIYISQTGSGSEGGVQLPSTEELCRHVYISQTGSGSEGGVQLPSTEELCRHVYISQTGSGSEGGVQLPSTEELCMVAAGRLPESSKPFSKGVPPVLLHPPGSKSRYPPSDDAIMPGMPSQAMQSDGAGEAPSEPGGGSAQDRAPQAPPTIELKYRPLSSPPWFVAVPLKLSAQTGHVQMVGEHVLAHFGQGPPGPPGTPDIGPCSFVDWDLIASLALGPQPLHPEAYRFQSCTAPAAGLGPQTAGASTVAPSSFPIAVPEPNSEMSLPGSCLAGAADSSAISGADPAQQDGSATPDSCPAASQSEGPASSEVQCTEALKKLSISLDLKRSISLLHESASHPQPPSFHLSSPDLPPLTGSVILDGCSGRLYCCMEDAVANYGCANEEEEILGSTLDSPCPNIRYVSYRQSFELHYPKLSTRVLPMASPLYPALRLASMRQRTNLLAKGSDPQTSYTDGDKPPADASGPNPADDLEKNEDSILADLTGRVWRALQQLPSLMYRMEGMLAAIEFREKVVLPLNLVMASLSSRSCCDEGVCLELLEFLGDAVLKYAASVLLHFRLSADHEGVLSALKARLVCNEALLNRGMVFPKGVLTNLDNLGAPSEADAASEAPPPGSEVGPPSSMETGESGGEARDSKPGKPGQRGQANSRRRKGLSAKAPHPKLETPLQLDTYLRAQPLNCLQFWACRSLLDDPTRLVRRLADGVEALIGAVFVHVLDTDGSTPSAAHGGATPPSQRRPGGPNFTAVPAAVNAAALVCERMGVLPLGAYQAISEAQEMGRAKPPQEPPCYQGLEFLGDAVLDLAATLQLWQTFVVSGGSEIGDASPGLLTVLRGRLVNNARLADLVARCGIFKFARIGPEDVAVGGGGMLLEELARRELCYYERSVWRRVRRVCCLRNWLEGMLLEDGEEGMLLEELADLIQVDPSDIVRSLFMMGASGAGTAANRQQQVNVYGDQAIDKSAKQELQGQEQQQTDSSRSTCMETKRSTSQPNRSFRGRNSSKLTAAGQRVWRPSDRQVSQTGASGAGTAANRQQQINVNEEQAIDRQNPNPQQGSLGPIIPNGSGDPGGVAPTAAGASHHVAGSVVADLVAERPGAEEEAVAMELGEDPLLQDGSDSGGEEAGQTGEGEQAGEGEKEIVLDGAGKWRSVAAGSPPKVLSDILEAILAAIFLDSSCDVGVAWEAYCRLADMAAAGESVVVEVLNESLGTGTRDSHTSVRRAQSPVPLVLSLTSDSGNAPPGADLRLR
eukprot:gene15041-21112_t